MLDLVSPEETPGSRCSQVCGGKVWVRSTLLQKLWFGKPHVCIHRLVRFCSLSVSPFGEHFEPAPQNEGLAPPAPRLRSAFKLIQSPTKVCVDMLVLGESRVGWRMTGPLAVPTRWVWVAALVMSSVVSGHVWQD